MALTNSRGSDNQKELVCIHCVLWKPDNEVRVSLRGIESFPKEVQKQVMSSSTCQSFTTSLHKTLRRGCPVTAPNGTMGRQKV